jgi:hypothetical protein
LIISRLLEESRLALTLLKLPQNIGKTGKEEVNREKSTNAGKKSKAKGVDGKAQEKRETKNPDGGNTAVGVVVS